MALLLLLFSLMTSTSTTTPWDDIGTCSFTQDCKQYRLCQRIPDASCVCNFGNCVIRSYPFFRGSECNQYTDCACSTDPDNCSCEGGFCRTEPVECHKSQDCKRMDKCKEKECNCQSNLCAWQCDTTADCKDYYCNKALGWTCGCEASICEFVKKPEECKDIGDCVSKGLCKKSEPCDCTQNYCETPHWVNDKGNCRKDQDCEDSILECKGKKCVCANIVAINEWTKRGKCELVSSAKTKSKIHFPTN